MMMMMQQWRQLVVAMAATILAATVLAGLLTLAEAGQSDRRPVSVSLESLCADRPIELTRSSQVRALAEELRTGKGSDGCAGRVRLALVELDELVNNSDMKDVCSLEEVEKIREFYERHIGAAEAAATTSASNQEQAAAAAPVPRALRDFVLAYGLRVSNLCKKNMINSLQYESERLLKPADFEHLNPWTDERSAISQIMDEPSDYDDLLLPRDLKRVLQDAQGADETQNGNANQPPAGEGDKIFLQTATGHIIERTQALCERRFKPLYEQLILPLIYLSNLGFNYQGDDLERERREMSANKDIHQWYRIVYLCESLTGIEIVEDPRDSQRTEGTDKRLVRILSREEAAALQAEQKRAAPLPRQRQANADIELVQFKAEYGNRLEDLVIDSSDRNFMRLLNSFDTHKSELARIRSKLLKKMARFLFDKLKRGQFKFMGSLISGGGKQGEPNNGEPTTTNDEMVKVFDDYVSQASGETPVSGLLSKGVGGVAKRYYHQAASTSASSLAARLKKNTIDKANVGRYFYYALAIAIFIFGAVFLAAG